MCSGYSLGRAVPLPVYSGLQFTARAGLPLLLQCLLQVTWQLLMPPACLPARGCPVSCYTYREGVFLCLHLQVNLWPTMPIPAAHTWALCTTAPFWCHCAWSLENTCLPLPGILFLPGRTLPTTDAYTTCLQYCSVLYLHRHLQGKALPTIEVNFTLMPLRKEFY